MYHDTEPYEYVLRGGTAFELKTPFFDKVSTND